MELDAEKPTLNAFERFLYWFFIPIVFTAVLVGALLSLFDYNVKNELLKFGHKVPGLAAVLPEVKGDAADKGSSISTTTAQDPSTAATAATEEAVEDLKKQLEEKEATLKAADEASLEKDQQIKDLQAQLTAQQDESKAQALSDEEYEAKIKETASMYAKMSASKAAPVIQNLTPAEQVLIFSQMTVDQRVPILEKMDPAAAAQVSIALKDITPAKDKQLAALQERLKASATGANAKSTGETSSTMTKSDLGQTFASMTPKSAADLLVQMEKTTPAKVTEILNSMDSTSRSKIMSAITDTTVAASIAARLAP